MNDLVEAYIEFLVGVNNFEKLPMPNIDVSAYTESEYVYAIKELEEDFKFINDEHVTESFIKGE